MTESTRPPRTVAILGASEQRHKFGNKSLRAHVHAGWRVIPVNPTAVTIEGLSVASALREIDHELDRISVYLPPTITLRLLPEIAAAQAREVWLNPGSADVDVLAAARELEIPIIDGCSIVDLGLSPAQFP